MEFAFQSELEMYVVPSNWTRTRYRYTHAVQLETRTLMQAQGIGTRVKSLQRGSTPLARRLASNEGQRTAKGLCKLRCVFPETEGGNKYPWSMKSKTASRPVCVQQVKTAVV